MTRAILLSAVLLLSGCATVTPLDVPPAAKAELAPTGALRAALLGPNPVLVTQNTPPGVVKGVGVEIARRLADRLGVPMTTVLYPSVVALMEGARKGEWDITFLAVDPDRATAMNFTAPVMFSESTCLLPAGSTAASLADLDRPGKSLVAVARSAQETWLRANVRSATVVSASSPAIARRMVEEGKIDAYASLTSVLAETSRHVPGSRLLPGSFDDAQIAMAVIKVRPAADAFAYEFVEQLKASGAIGEMIEREGLKGVRAAR